MRSLRFAVLGTGFWSQFQIAAWREVEGVELVALYNRTLPKADALAKRFGVPRVYGDPEELLLQEQPDFVDVITEVPAHATLVLLAARHRVPVICQKPMGPDLETCERMVRECREAAVPFFVHENFRWQTPMRAVKRALDEGRIGKPYRALIRLGHGPRELLANQPQLLEMEHWALMDMGTHSLDLARFFFGEAQSVYCQTRKTLPQANGEDIASAMIKMGDVICLCEHGWVDDPTVFVEGTRGTLELRTDNSLTVTNEEGTATERHDPPSYPWVDWRYGACQPSIVDCNAHLLQALRSGAPAETSGEDNLRTMRLVFAAYDSAARDEVVKISPGP